MRRAFVMARIVMWTAEAHDASFHTENCMSNKNDKNEIMSISIDDLDVSELETRIELATATTSCDCHGSCTGKCDSFTAKGAVANAGGTC